MLHRDIKPGNIRVKANGKAVLIDFGAARQAIGLRSQSISTILTPGYAPIEQYSTRGNQGPWTDIYALAAVGYVCLTGENLSHYEATERIRNDQLPRLVDRIKSGDQVFLAALDWALSPEESDRPQTVQEWLLAIENGVIPNAGPLAADAEATKRIAAPGNSEPPSSVKNKAGDSAGTAEGRKTPFSLGMVVVVFGLVVGGVMFFLASDMGKPVADNQIVMNAAKVEDEGETIPEGVAEVPSEAKKPKAAVSPRPAATPASKPKDFIQDDRDFETASKINTAEAYELYARLHPNGRHRSKATRSRY
jgi:serine/threonine protein kinase